MNVPRYWARTDASATGPHGEHYALALWGWSNESAADALRNARERLSEVVARLGRGESLDRTYLYGSHPLREEIVQALPRRGEADEAIITRNGYGALILNAARVPFVDVDLPRESPFKRVFRSFRGGASLADEVLDRIRRGCQRHASNSFRVYRTKAGYRVIATDLPLDPGSDAARTFLEGFGADPAFTRLCRLQSSFRARLTPKPWRLGLDPPPGRHPREDHAEREAFAIWLQRYEEASYRHAACAYLESIGGDRELPGVGSIVEEHDRASRAHSELPLA